MLAMACPLTENLRLSGSQVISRSKLPVMVVSGITIGVDPEEKEMVRGPALKVIVSIVAATPFTLTYTYM